MHTAASSSEQGVRGMKTLCWMKSCLCKPKAAIASTRGCSAYQFLHQHLTALKSLTQPQNLPAQEVVPRRKRKLQH
jgi:hypothetical protein